MARAIASNALTLLIVALVCIAGIIAWGQGEYRAEGPLDAPMCLRVPSGTNMYRVSENLAAREAIVSPRLFRIGAEYSDKAQKLKAGAYLVPAHASMEDIVDIVTRGGASTCGTEVVYRLGVNRLRIQVRELDPTSLSYVETAVFDRDILDDANSDPTPARFSEVLGESDTRFRIAVAEGTTVWRVIKSLETIQVLDGALDATDWPAEGMIAPDSYEVLKGDPVTGLLDRMVQAQEERIESVWAARSQNLPLDSPQDMLVLASIIEKETGKAQERPQVASVFVNRLNQGMRLQTDPTVIYGVTNGVGYLGRGLRQSELQSDSPYNTYAITGLPPGPIANPGLAALQAAVNPDTTPYIFFVADGTGGHAFAETLAEHNRNVAVWREIEAQRAADQ